jgi:hypothetical protein
VAASSATSCSLFSSVSRTQRMAASQIASLVGKCLKTAPWVMPTAAAMSAVVMRAGLDSRASSNAAATIPAWRSSVDKRVCMVVEWAMRR